jgi:serine/threonine protein kinase
MSIQIIEGLRCSRQKNAIQFDLKSQNILMFKDEIITIADFALAKIVQQYFISKNTMAGTPIF